MFSFYLLPLPSTSSLSTFYILPQAVLPSTFYILPSTFGLLPCASYLLPSNLQTYKPTHLPPCKPTNLQIYHHTSLQTFYPRQAEAMASGRGHSAVAYHVAALRDETRLTGASTVDEINRVRDKLLLRACLISLLSARCDRFAGFRCRR